MAAIVLKRITLGKYSITTLKVLVLLAALPRMLGPLAQQMLAPLTVNMVAPPASVTSTGGGHAWMTFGGTDSHSH